MQNRFPFLLGLLLLIIVGSLLRIGPAFSAPLWFDEADTWRSGIIDPASSGWSTDTGLYEPRPMEYGKFFRWQNHFETAPLTFLLARISTDLLGTTDPWAMRLPSLIAGILCIPAAFWLGRVVRNDAVGLVTAALITFDPSQVDQSHQCRMYTIMMLLMLLVIGLTIKLIREPEAAMATPSLPPSDDQTPASSSTASSSASSNSPHPALARDRSLSPVWQWVLLGAMLGLLLCTSQFNIAVWVGIALGAFALLAMGIITRQPHPKTPQVATGLTCAFAVGLMLANVGVHSIIHRVFHGGAGDRPDLTHLAMVREIIVAAKDLINLTPAGLVIYLLAAIGLLLLFKHCKTSTAILVGVAFANLLMLFKFLRIHHFMDPRYLLCIVPALYLGLAMFATALHNPLHRRIAFALVAIHIAVQAWQATHLIDYYQQPDRYLFTQSIIKARDEMKPGETASLYPGVACILGQYYQLPQDPTLFTGLYRMADHMPQPQPQVPADLKATAVHLVMGMYNHETSDGKQRHLRTQTIETIARHYGITLTETDRTELTRHLQQRRILTAHISGQGVIFSSVGVD